MQLFPIRGIARGICLVMLLLVAGQAYGQQQPGKTICVSETYNNTPFNYHIRLQTEHDGFRIYRLTYPSSVVTQNEPNNTIPAYLYLPADIKPGDAQRPVVICLHVLNGDMKASEFACSAMAMRGIPAIMFWLPYYGDRQLPTGWRTLLKDPNLFLAAISQSIEDIRRTVDLLGSRPEIDSQRVGLIGFSLGGIIAASAAGVEPRIHKTALFLAGGDVLDIVHFARYTRSLSEAIHQMSPDEQADFKSRVEAIEPLRLAGALRERAQNGKVMMVNAAEDEIIPRRCTERLATALGIADRIDWIEGFEHDTFLAALPQVTHKVVDYFAQDLPPGVKPYAPPAVATLSAPQLFLDILRQAVSMLATEPGAGCSHRMELNLSLHRKDTKEPLNVQLNLVRGESQRFALRCTLPTVGDVLIGQDKYPWMVVAGKHVLAGVQHPVENRNPLCFVNQRHLAKLRVASSMIEGLTMVPDALDQWANIEDEKTAEGRRAISVTIKNNFSASMTMALRNDGATPDHLAFDILGRSGTISIRDWKYGGVAADALFEPPADLVQIQVDQTDLYHLFSVVFNLTMELLL